MALFDFQIMYSGITSIPIVPDTIMGVTVYSKFTNLYNEEHESYIYLNPDIISSGFNFIQVGGTAIGGQLEQHVGLVIEQSNQRRITAVSDSIEYVCHTRPDENFQINDTILIYEHISHKPGQFGNQIWNATKKVLVQPGIISMILDLKGAGGSGIGRINIDPYTGEAHYGSGLES